MEESVVKDHEVVRRVIWEQVPELRERFVQVERWWGRNELEQGKEPYVGVGTLLSKVLVHPYLMPLIDDADGDEGALGRCAAAVEQILEAHSEYLDAAVRVWVVPCLLCNPDGDPDGGPERWLRFRRYAGPLLKECVRSEVQYYSEYCTWPDGEPVF